jgi:putative ABC transport system permease protein
MGLDGTQLASVGSMSLLSDVRFGARLSLRRPTFMATALLTLSVGIGTTTAIFSLVNAVLLRPLPYADPDRLYQVDILNLKTSRVSSRTSPLNFADLRDLNRTFSTLGGYVRDTPLTVAAHGTPERVDAALVSATFLPTLGASPTAGRAFSPEDDRPTVKPTVAIISERLATRYFGGVPEALGKTITLDLRPHIIVGVMPASFGFPSRNTDAWVPLGFVYTDGGRGNFFVDVIGRLAPGVSAARAESDLRGVAARLARLYPEEDTDLSVAITPLRDALTHGVRSTVLLLFAAAGLVLLIACANVANLLLVRASGRSREMAVRRALGASRARLIRQLLSESTLLAIGGGLAGLLVAAWCLRAFAPLLPADLPTVGPISLDGRVFAFAFAVALLTGMLFGLAPAWHASSPGVVAALRNGRTVGHDRSATRWLLVVGEVALSLTLLVGAGLLVRSLWQVLAVQPGFDPHGVLSFDVSLPFTRYDRSATVRFFSQAIDRLSALPGVQSAAATTVLPLHGDDNSRYFTLEGRQGNAPRDYTIANHRLVSQRYFSTLDVPVIKGRGFTDADLGPEAAPVLVVNQAFGRSFLGGADPIGRRLKMGETADNSAPWMTIVGIVGDVRHSSLEIEDRAELYRPFAQTTNGEGERTMTVVLRTAQAPESLTEAARETIRGLDPDQPIANVATMDHLLAVSLGPRRFSLVLIEVFAITALLLTSVGIYGVVSYGVEQNARAIGVRIALGARTRDILVLVLGPGVAWTGAGVLLGIGGALGISRVMAGLLFGVAPTDPTSFLATSALLLVVTVTACYVPARRATRVDPVTTLRSD